MGLVSFLDLRGLERQSRRPIIEFAIVQSKRLEPAHQESAAPPFPLTQSSDLFSINVNYMPVPISVPAQYEFILEGDVHGVFTYRSSGETFRQLWETTKIGDRVEVDYTPRFLLGDLIVGVREHIEAL